MQTYWLLPPLSGPVSSALLTVTLLQPVNGQTVGNKVIDLLTASVTALGIRFTCTAAIRADVYLRDFAAFQVTPP